MTKSLSIAIIHHRNQSPASEEIFIISWIGQIWREWGHSVQHVYGPTQGVEADVAVLHVDRSVVPESHLRFAQQFPATVNIGLVDITKRKVSSNLVTRDDDYHGPVVVKTNLNHAGTPECQDGPVRVQSPFLKRIQWRIRGRLKRRLGMRDPHAIRSPADYMIYRRKSLVPKSVFDDERLIAERFLPERRGDLYLHRRYYFLGEAERNECWSSSDPLNPCDEEGEIESVDEPVPDALREHRRQASADYGKIDYVIRDGRVEVFDINRTPSSVVLEENPGDAQWMQDVVESLAPGILTCVRG